MGDLASRIAQLLESRPGSSLREIALELEPMGFTRDGIAHTLWELCRMGVVAKKGGRGGYRYQLSPRSVYALAHGTARLERAGAGSRGRLVLEVRLELEPSQLGLALQLLSRLGAKLVG